MNLLFMGWRGVKVFSCVSLFIQKHCLKVPFFVVVVVVVIFVDIVVAAVVVMYNT